MAQPQPGHPLMRTKGWFTLTVVAAVIQRRAPAVTRDPTRSYAPAKALRFSAMVWISLVCGSANFAVPSRISVSSICCMSTF